jgi:cytoskeleton protein RodZ
MTPPDADVTELPSSPGARLRREREARGLTEQQAAEALNLDPVVIGHLERNDFASLGAPVFVKGHLRRYATLLELGSEEIVGAYERSSQHVDEPTLVPRARLEMEPVRGQPRWPWVVGGIVTFLLAAALIAYVSENGLPWDRETDESVADESASTDSASVDAIGPASTTALTAAPAPAATAAGTGASAGTASAVSSPAPVGGQAAPAPGPGQVALQLRFSADSWVEIFDGTGKAVVYDLGRAGSERTLIATPPLSVTLGNAPGVAVTVNGRAVPTPPLAQGAVARFSVAADGTLR